MLKKNSNIHTMIVEQIKDVEKCIIHFENFMRAATTAETVHETLRALFIGVQDAEAEADRIIQAAEADKAARIAEAEGQAARFVKMYEEYQKFPLITKKRMFYETMEEVLPDLKIIVTDGNTQTLMPLESFNAAGGTN